MTEPKTNEPLLTFRVEPPAVREALENGSIDPTLPVVLCLHGWGMDGDLFARLTQGLFEVPALFVYPTAPKQVQKDDGSTVHISSCPDGHGKVKSPMCCGEDMICSIG